MHNTGGKQLQLQTALCTCGLIVESRHWNRNNLHFNCRGCNYDREDEKEMKLVDEDDTMGGNQSYFLNPHNHSESDWYNKKINDWYKHTLSIKW